jgi:tripartite-type tricarboxylate transporter receptor subunit TctC
MPFSIALFAIWRLGMTNRRQILASIAAASSGTLLDMLRRPARAQTIQKLTRIIIGTPPGGYPDTVARLLIDHMKSYASTIILENKPGAGQRIALEALKNSAADGSTMMLSPAGPNVPYPHIYKTLSYKPLEDFIPVTTVFDTPSALVVGPMVPPQVKTVADFVGWCRANPTKSAYGTPGAGTPMHFLGVMLATAGGVTYLHVPYQGSGPATQDVLGGQIASAIVPVPAVVQLREPDRLRVLATTGPERSASLPDVPSMKEAGFPALEFSEWFGILLPAQTPVDIAIALNGAVRNAMSTDEFKRGLLTLSLEPAGSSMSDFAQRMRTDTERWAPIIKASGFTIE